MTWEELFKKVICNKIHCNRFIIHTSCGNFTFYENKEIWFEYHTSVQIAKNRTPDQMYQIIKALTETKE